MPPPRSPQRFIAAFFLRLILAYAALMTAWPLVKSSYAAYHRGLGNRCFSSFGSSGVVKFEPAPKEDPVRDTIIRIEDRRTPGVELNLPISARYTAYMPTAFLTCLILATPLAWKRRLIALAWGWTLVHLFIVLWLAISLLDEMSSPAAPLRVFQLTGMDKTILRFVATNVVDSVIATAYVAPIFIWIIAAFRRQDREQIVRALLPQEMKPPVGSPPNQPNA